MNELALFAGAGGGILGGKLLGWRTRCAVEIDSKCREKLFARQRDGILERFPIWDDVKTFDGRRWRGEIDVVSGGFPCQDISSAGSGKGLEGERSGLWKEMARVISEVQPNYVLVENSPLLISRGLDIVLADLAGMGFDAEWGIISAADVGAWHLRRRTWIVAHTNSLRELQSKDSEPNEWRRIDNSAEKQNPSYTDLQGFKISSGGSRQKKEKSRWDIPTEYDWRKPEMAEKDIFKPCFRGMVHGNSGGMDRVRALGNAQVPAVVELAWKVLTN